MVVCMVVFGIYLASVEIIILHDGLLVRHAEPAHLVHWAGHILSSLVLLGWILNNKNLKVWA